MNAPTPFNPDIATMSSREIAQLTGSRHPDVIRSIQRLMDDGILTTPLALSDFNVRGKDYSEYHLPKRDSLVVVARLSPEFTAAIVDRWQELENGEPIVDEVALIEHSLKLIKDQRLKIQQQAAKIAEDAPKVQYMDKYMDSTGLRGIRDAAKSLKFGPKAFADALKADKYLYYLDGGLSAYQKYLDSGLFDVIEGSGNSGHNYNQTKITAKGMSYFAQRYATELGK